MFCLGTGYEDQLRLNAVIREIFINRFLHIFHSFHHFVIHTEEELNLSGESQQDSQFNFDKISFLSEQVCFTLLPWIN